MTTKEAMNQLITQLETDPGYRIAWQANIAVKFQDAWQKAVDDGGLPCTPEHVHKISNDAADAFLKLLCYQSEEK